MIKGFPRQALELLRCPCDSGLLEINNEGQLIENGQVLCAKNPQHRYQIIDGILRLMPALDELKPELQSEIKARDQEASTYDNKLSSRFDKELRSTLEVIGSVRHKKVIEYGSGTGRVTVHLLEADLLVAVDFSYESLVILAQKISDRDNIALVQSEVTSLKTKSCTFDVAVSIQVVEHIPTRQMRSDFFRSVKLALAPAGVFILSAYHFDLRRKIQNKPKVGVHSSGITFLYFREWELKEEMRSFFDFKIVKKIDITWPLEMKLGLSKHWGGFLSRLGEKVPLVNDLGHLLIVKTKKKSDVVHYWWGLVYKWFLVKHWFWFSDPEEVSGAAMVNFFSYNDTELPGFYQKVGLTTIINLTDDLKDIFSNFRQKFIQKQIRRGEKNKILVRYSRDTKKFKQLYRQFRGFNNLPKERLGPVVKAGDIFLAYYGNKLVAGGLFLGNGTIMRAWALVSYPKDDVSREIIGQANRLLLWAAIGYAKSVGYTKFDLGGISPDSANSHLRTLAEFKEAFGGERQKTYYYYKVYSSVIRWWMRWKGFKHV
jgi:SAM-dependent methyltransferase